MLNERSHASCLWCALYVNRYRVEAIYKKKKASAKEKETASRGFRIYKKGEGAAKKKRGGPSSSDSVTTHPFFNVHGCALECLSSDEITPT